MGRAFVRELDRAAISHRMEGQLDGSKSVTQFLSEPEPVCPCQSSVLSREHLNQAIE